MVPPATLKKALAKKPSNHLVMRIVSMFGATAHGMIQMKVIAKEPRYIGRRP